MRSNASEPVIVTGDLNITSDRCDSYASLCRILTPLKNATKDARRFRSFRLKPSPGSLFVEQILGPLWRSRWPRNFEPLSLDHVFYSGIRLKSAELINWSSEQKGVFVPVLDHLGVLVDVTLWN